MGVSIGGSKKKSITTNNTTTTNQGFSEVSGSVANVSGNNNTITDGGAIAGALALAQSTVEQSSQNISEVVGKASEGANIVEVGKWGLVAVGLLVAAVVFKR